jgi:hypothetical protein
MLAHAGPMNSVAVLSEHCRIALSDDRTGSQGGAMIVLLEWTAERKPFSVPLRVPASGVTSCGAIHPRVWPSIFHCNSRNSS